MNLSLSHLISVPVLSLLVLGAALSSQGCASAGEPEPVEEGSDQLISAGIDVCGTVRTHVKANLLATGLLVVEGVPLVLRADQSIEGEALLKPGAEVCVSASLADGKPAKLSVTAASSATASVKLCGQVSAFIPATSQLAGKVTISGASLAIQAGAHFTGESQIKAGANVCLEASLTTLGQAQAPGHVEINASAQGELCGVVGAYLAATSSSAGSLELGQRTYPIAANLTIANDDLLTAGADVCIQTALIDGKISAAATVVAEATATARFCGALDAHVAATATADGSLDVGSSVLTIRAGTTVEGAAALSVGAAVCCDLSLDAVGKIVATSSCAATPGQGS